jgi:hypothetical protein
VGIGIIQGNALQNKVHKQWKKIDFLMPSPDIYTVRTVDSNDILHVGRYSDVSDNALALRVADDLLLKVSDVEL